MNGLTSMNIAGSPQRGGAYLAPLLRAADPAVHPVSARRSPPRVVWKRLFLLLWFFPFLTPYAQELPFTHYTTENEINPLPSSGITSIHQDSLGYIWIAAYGVGLVRYDGDVLQQFGYDDSLKASSIWGIAEDGNGRLWVGSENGLFVSEKPLPEYAGSGEVRFASHIGAVSLHDSPIRGQSDLVRDSRGWIWYAPREDYLVRYRIKGPDPVIADTIPLPPGRGGNSEQVVNMAGRRDGSVWVSLTGGRMMVIEGEEVSYSLLENLPCSASQTLFETPAGALWGGCRDGTLWRSATNGDSRQFTTLGATYPGMVTSMLEDASGKIWVAGLGGGLRMLQADGTPLAAYTRKQGLLDENIWDLMQDREGSYWIAQNSGLSKLRMDYEAFNHYTGASHAGEPPALPALDVDSALPLFTVFPSARGDSLTLMVAGTPGGAALIRNDGVIEHLTTDQGLSSNLVLDLCRGGEGEVWIGTRNGANRLTFGKAAPALPGASQTRTLSLFGHKAHLASFDIGHVTSCQALTVPAATDDLQARTGVCFAGTASLHCLIENNWYAFGRAAGLPDDDLWTTTTDEHGYIYVGSRNEGIFRSTLPFADVLLKAIPERASPRSSIRKVNTPVFESLKDRMGGGNLDGFSSSVWVDQVLWAVGDGIIALEGSPFSITTRFNRDNGFDANPESMAFSHRTKTLWVGTAQGLVEIDPAARTMLRWVTKQDGLVGNVVWGPGAVAIAADGTVYFATSTGLSLYRPHLDRKNAYPPEPRLRRVRFSEDQSGHNELYIEYAALSFANEKKVRYKTRLQGFDKDWSPEKTATSTRYTNLGAFLTPRTYTFEVLAANEDGLWSEKPLAYAVSVQPAWWLRWWALLAYLLIAGAGILVVDRVQRRRLIHREREASRLRENELRAETAEAWANYLQAENMRQTQELEQARQLQLSMLPERVPILPTVDIAAYMKTATEVGGDYYDFYLAPDGTLTLTIGDATGHGLLAGTMVTAMKSLWNAYAQEPDLEQMLRKSDRALKRMRLPKLYMALALARLRMPVLELVGAGMPPALCYRAATREMEIIPLKGMPLGGPGELPYLKSSMTLSAGDTVLLMSDGFPEMRDASGKMLGYEHAMDIFFDMADQSAEEIIGRLEEKVSAWCNGQQPADDVTFLVLKVRGAAHNTR